MEKIKKLAKTIVDYSIDVQKGENVLISADDICAKPLIKELIIEIKERLGNPFVVITDQEIERLLLNSTTDSRIEVLKKNEEFNVDNYQSFIRIRCNINDYMNRDVPSDTINAINKSLEKSHDIRVNERKWVLLNYPTSLDAYKSFMSNDDFYSFAMDVMCLNYKGMARDIEPLKKLMEKTDKVRLTGEGTDISFSIKDMPIIPCCGTMNIPDGEIFCGPVRDSVNGVIRYNTPSPYRGNVFHGVTLTFNNGKITKAVCDEENLNSKLNEIFESDDGAKYVGEFSIGLNPLIREPMGDILFDEKIIGSIHFTPGAAYKESYNGNDSIIHWDMVLIQREDYGGGDIYFDDVLIRHNGEFVLEELKHLNYR